MRKIRHLQLVWDKDDKKFALPNKYKISIIKEHDFEYDVSNSRMLTPHGEHRMSIDLLSILLSLNDNDPYEIIWMLNNYFEDLFFIEEEDED